MRNQSADNQGVAEQKPSTRLKHALQITKYFAAPRNMTEHIIRINGIEGIIFDGETLRHIALLKLHAGTELVFFSQCLGVAYTIGIYIES